MAEVKKEEEVKQVIVDANTIMFLLYLLYKTNMISNLQLREAVNEIKKPAPPDLLEYFNKEFKKI